MPTRRNLLRQDDPNDPRNRTIYRNDPLMLSRTVDPATGQEIREYGPPEIRPSLEPRQAPLSPRDWLARNQTPIRIPQVQTPMAGDVDPEGLGYERDPVTGGILGYSASRGAALTQRGETARQEALRQVAAQTGNLEAEAAVRRRSLEPVEVPGVGKVPRELLPIIQAREAAKEAERIRQTPTAYQNELLEIRRSLTPLQEATLAEKGKEKPLTKTQYQLALQKLSSLALREIGNIESPYSEKSLPEVMAELAPLVIGMELEELQAGARGSVTGRGEEVPRETAPTAQGGTVRMKATNGQLYDVPTGSVEAAKQRGAVEVQ